MDRCHQRDNPNPSFSSTLLDAIYRSIDESNGKGEEEKEVIFYRESTRKKHNNNGFTEEIKACMVEKWMQEKVSYEKVSVRRKSMADFDKIRVRNDFNKPHPAVLLNSSSTSSESSCGGAFSSSESESFYGGLNSAKSSSTYTMQRPKPIRTSVSTRPERYERTMDEIGLYTSTAATQKPKKEGTSFGKTKSKALKIYGDLKKVKQPISPGGRLASFLNSLFTTGNAKKAKILSSSTTKSEQTSACSSASSFSRSCLSKTPSSFTRGNNNKLNNGTKRSVRFYPVSVIVDEDSRPCGHKNVYGNNQDNNILLTKNNEELKFHVMKESRRVEEVARDLLKNYQKKKEEELRLRDLCNNGNNGKFSDEDQELDDYDDDDDDDDDGASYASSDLFELDNLSAVGINQRYCQELPVYETTHLDTNRAIANGLIL